MEGNKLSANITNASENVVYVSSDPAWDEQKLCINGELVTGSFPLQPNAKCEIEFQVDGVDIIISNKEDSDAEDAAFICVSFDLDQGSNQVIISSQSAEGDCFIIPDHSDSKQITCHVEIYD